MLAGAQKSLIILKIAMNYFVLLLRSVISIGVLHAGDLDERFKAPDFASWAELEQSAPDGRCWVTIATCKEHPSHVGLFDESIDAYEELGLGENESTCLGRARFNWLYCGNNLHQPITMIFRPTGASLSYPPDHIVDDASERRSKLSAFPKLNSYLKPDALWAMQIPANEGRFVTKDIVSLLNVNQVRHLLPNNDLGQCWFYIPFCDLAPQ